jgi:23S rRNA pseudouridine955/2504/2580 synthase
MSLLEVTIKTGVPTRFACICHRRGIPSWATTNMVILISTVVQSRASNACFCIAWRLQFNHPASGERVELRAELPPELADFVN